MATKSPHDALIKAKRLIFVEEADTLHIFENLKPAQRMESMSEIKLDLIHLITELSDYQQLKAIRQLLQPEAVPAKLEPAAAEDKFLLGSVEIREGVSKERVFEEQGHKPIIFEEVQALMTDEPWEQSLEEVLDSL